MGLFRIRHEFDCDPEAFWTRIFVNQDFYRRLYTNELAFERFEVIEEGFRDDGKFYRHVQVQPKTEVPTVLKKVLGETMGYAEKGVWDPNGDRKYRYDIIPSRMADRATISGLFWLEALGAHRCARICEMNIEVRAFGVGRMVESFVERSTRDGYEAGTRLTKDFIREQGLGRPS